MSETSLKRKRGPEDTPATAAQTSKTGAEDPKLARFVQWLQSHGAEFPSLRLTYTGPAAGWTGTADAVIRPNEAVLRCPTELLLHADAAHRAGDFGRALREFQREEPEVCPERVVVWLLLIHCRHHPDSFWAPYVDILPSEADLDTLIYWTEGELEGLRGCAVVEEVGAARAELERIHGAAVERGLARQHPRLFDPAVFTLQALTWAYSVFWSRALSVPVGGRARECMVPLADMLNHRPGSVIDLRVHGPSAHEAKSQYALHAGRTLERGEEVMINYGAKGNGELLRCYGFVEEGNPLDVCPLDLAALPRPPAQTAEQRAQCLGVLREERLPCKVFLFHDALPPQLLDAVRILCMDATDIEHWRARKDHPDDEAAESTVAPQGFDWSAVDWSADDPFASCAASNQEDVLSPRNERASLQSLRALLQTRMDEIGDAEQSKDDRSIANDGDSLKHEAREHSAAVYRSGQWTLLKDASLRVGNMMQGAAQLDVE